MQRAITNYHFILEGPDGVGKSTLANQLKEYFKIPIIRMEVETLNNIEIQSVIFNKTVPQFKEYPFILDRWWISSMVYAKVYNRSDDLRYIEKFKKILPNSYLVYLHAPIETLLARKNDELIVPEKLKKICAQYEETITNELCNDYFDHTISIDTSKQDQFKTVLEYMQILPEYIRS